MGRNPMRNTLKTFTLLAALTAIFVGIGYSMAGLNGMLIAFGLAVAMNLFSYWNSDKIVLKMYRAAPVDDSHPDPRVRAYASDVRDLAARAQMPLPKIYIIDQDQPNATMDHYFEACMTLDKYSWGANRKSSAKDYLTMKELLLTLVQTISRNGNLLINVGPNADGTINPLMVDRLLGMGEWLSVNGEAVYSTRSWSDGVRIGTRE